MGVAFTLAAVMVLIAVAALAGGDTADDAATGSDAITPTVSEPPGSDDAAATTTAASPSSSAVVTLGELADRVAADPDSFGEKGSDLLYKLQEVQREKPERGGPSPTALPTPEQRWGLPADH